MANTTTGKLIPKPDYELDRSMYQEINDITERLRRLIRMAKIAGAFDKAFPELQRIWQEADEGQLIGIGKFAGLSEKGGLKGAMDFLPIDQVVEGIQALAQRRVEQIQLLDQVIGLSAAIRGQADPNSTATANRIEAGFASTRLEVDKDEVARFATDLTRLRAELIARHYDAKSIVKCSNAERMEIDPKTQQPNWPLIMQAVDLIKSDISGYRISIKSDSIAMRDYATMKQERIETLQALTSVFQSSVPMVQEMGPKVVPFLLELGKWLIASTKGSQQIEGIFDRFVAEAEAMANQPPQPPQPDPKLQAAQVKAQAEMAKAKTSVQQTQMDAHAHAQKTAMDMEKSRQEFGQNMAELEAKKEMQATTAIAGRAIPVPGVV
jgi:hypothetical protein